MGLWLVWPLLATQLSPGALSARVPKRRRRWEGVGAAARGFVLRSPEEVSCYWEAGMAGCSRTKDHCAL